MLIHPLGHGGRNISGRWLKSLKGISEKKLYGNLNYYDKSVFSLKIYREHIYKYIKILNDFFNVNKILLLNNKKE